MGSGYILIKIYFGQRGRVMSIMFVRDDLSRKLLTYLHSLTLFADSSVFCVPLLDVDYPLQVLRAESIDISIITVGTVIQGNLGYTSKSGLKSLDVELRGTYK